MDGKEPSLEIPQMQGREENLGFGLPTNAVVSAKFNDRVNEVFGSLQSLEQRHTETVATFATNEYDADEEEEERASDDESSSSKSCNNEPHKRQPKNQEMLSKCDLRRKLDSNKCQNVPNYVVNPEKWKKYSLKDDGSSSMSTGRSADELNTAVAMDFLCQLKKRKGADATTSADISASDQTSSIDKANDDHKFSVPALPSRTQHKETTDDNDDVVVASKACSSNRLSKAWCMQTFEFGKSSGPTAMKKKRLPAMTDGVESGKCGVVLDHCQHDENEDHVNGMLEEKESSDIKIDDVDDTGREADNSASASSLFSSRGRKQKKCIRKRQHSDDDDDGVNNGDV